MYIYIYKRVLNLHLYIYRERMDDIDVKGMMARDLFLELCAPLMDKLAKVQI